MGAGSNIDNGILYTVYTRFASYVAHCRKLWTFYLAYLYCVTVNILCFILANMYQVSTAREGSPFSLNRGSPTVCIRYVFLLLLRLLRSFTSFVAYLSRSGSLCRRNLLHKKRSQISRKEVFSICWMCWTMNFIRIVQKTVWNRVTRERLP